jgi:hypothetical protein
LKIPKSPQVFEPYPNPEPDPVEKILIKRINKPTPQFEKILIKRINKPTPQFEKILIKRINKPTPHFFIKIFFSNLSVCFRNVNIYNFYCDGKE